MCKVTIHMGEHILAESTQRLSATLKAAQPGVNWGGIAAFRNVVVHGYLGVSVEQIWHIVERDVPGLKCKVEVILAEQDGGLASYAT